MHHLKIASLVFALLFGITSGEAMAHKAKKTARIFFENMTNEMTVHNPINIKFGAEGIPIAAVGINKHRAGHHHLLINVSEPISMDEVIPKDDTHLHYMNGETEATISLPPGKHTLQLILGDEEHQPWGEWLISEQITITVLPDSDTPAAK